MQDNDMPRALEISENPRRDFTVRAGERAWDRGRNSMEWNCTPPPIPADAILSTGSNHRTMRMRQPSESTSICARDIGSHESAQPDRHQRSESSQSAMPFNDIQDDNPVETYTALVKAISPLGLAYLHC